MRRIAVTITLLACLAVSLTAAVNPYTYLKSISVLQTAGRNMCSVTAINTEYYLTAAHCVVVNFPSAENPIVDATPNDNLTIDGKAAYLLDIDVLQDLAVLEVPGADRPAMKLAKKAPRLLDHVTMAGHPFGWDFPTVMVGTIAATSLRFTTNPNEFPLTKHYMILQVSGAPGNSGSSVVNERMEVVSVIQISWGRVFEPVMGSAPFEALARFAGKYFSK